MVLKRFFSVLTLVLALFSAWGQEDYIAVFGSVKDERTGSKLEGVNVKIFRDGKEFQNYSTPLNGKFEFDIDFDYSYDIHFEMDNYVTKFITIDARDVHPEDKIGGFGFDLEMALFKYVEGVNFDILKQPIGIAKYSRETGDIAFDYEYTRSIQAAIAKLRRELDQKIRENDANLSAEENQAQKELLKKQKFEQLVASGDSLMGENEVQQALEQYEEAKRLYPNNPVILNKIEAGNRSLEEYLALKTAELEYQKFVREGDRQLASGGYQRAIDNYERALKIKPGEVYPQAQIDEIKQILKEREEKRSEEERIAQAFADAMVNGAENFAAENYINAIQSFEQALTIIPGEPTAEMELARATAAFEKQQKEEGEQKRFEELVAQGDGSFGSEDYQAAEIYYKEALELKSGNAEVIQKLQETQRILAEIKKRAEEEKAKQQALNDLITQAKDAMGIENYEGALSILGEAQDLDPGNAEVSALIEQANDLLGKQKQFAEAIRQGDAAFAAEDWSVATVAYTEANNIKPSEKYPKDQLELIANRILEEEALEQQYADLIASGDAAFTAKNWGEAKNAYSNASNVKPGEQYPKDQLAKILEAESAELALQQQLQDLLEQGQSAEQVKDWTSAISNYQQALTLDPGNALAIEGIARAEEAQKEAAELEALQAAFEAKLQEATFAKDQGELESAKGLAQEALGIIAEEPRAMALLNEISKIQEEANKREEAYKTFISGGDDAFNAGLYDDAIGAYEAALGIKPNEEYPAQRIIDAQNAKEKAIAEALLDENYQKAIASGDAAFEQEVWTEATAAYQEALSLKPAETYPQDQINAIEAKIAEEEQLKSQFQSLVAKGKTQLGAGEFAGAEQDFQAALAIFPENKEVPPLLEEARKGLEELAQQEAIEKAYQEVIAKGEFELDNEAYTAAITQFEAALEIKPGDAYAEGRIRDINIRMQEIAEQEAQYNTAMEAGKVALAANDFDGAELSYGNALNVRPQDPAAMEALERVKQARIDFENLQADKEAYRTLMTQAEEKEAAASYDLAMDLYRQASEIFPENKNPKERIAAIETLLAEKAAKDQAFADYMSAGDQAMMVADYETAVGEFQRALEIYANNERALNQLELANQGWDAQKKEAARTASYDAFVRSGDDYMNQKDWERAIESYVSAQGVKPEETYPQSQIDLANREIAAYELRKAQAEEFITLGTEYEGKYEYAEAISNYEKALNLFPDNLSCQEKLRNAQTLFAAWEEKRKNAERKTSSFGDVSFYDENENSLESKLAEQERKKQELERQKGMLDSSNVSSKVVDANLNDEVLTMEEKRRKEEMERLEANRRKTRERVLEQTKVSYLTKPAEGQGFRIELGKQYPEGYTEEIIEEPNRTITKRVVVINGEGDEYLQIAARWGTYYFKNGRSITAELWKLEAFE